MKFKIKLKASITVETSLILPLFIFAIIVIIYFFKILILQEIIQQGLSQTGKYLSNYIYILQEENIDTNNILDKIFIKNKFKQFVNKDYIENSYIDNGLNGISFNNSKITENNNIIDIIATYKMKIPVFNIQVIKFLQRQRIYAFVGNRFNNDNKNNNEVDKIVYITETGTVYHTNKNCTHLNLSIKDTKLENIGNIRNNAGGKYKACEKCVDDNKQVIYVYITLEGNKYHYDIKCSGLKRIIKEVPISKLKNKSLCKRCTSLGD